MSPEMITEVTKAVITVVLVILSAYVVPWVKSRIGEDKYETILDFAEIVVRSAEKMFTPEEYAQKKAYAVNMLENKARELNIAINAKEINAIIEGAVQAVKG